MSDNENIEQLRDEVVASIQSYNADNQELRDVTGLVFNYVDKAYEI